MDIFSFLKKLAIIFMLIMLVSCGGSGGGSKDTSTPNASISPAASTYDFGSIFLNNSADQEFVITNTGDASLTINDISISPSGVPFSVPTDTCSNETLAENGTCSFTARFAPTSRIQSTATLSIPSNDPDGTASIALSGTGLGSQISISPSSYDFGGVVINNSRNQTFAVTNTGNSSLTISDVSLTDSSFSLFTDTCSDETFGVNGDCSMAVRFSPTTQQYFDGTMTILSDDPEQGTADIDLYGEGFGLNVWINKIEVDEYCNYTIDVTITNAETGEIINYENTDFVLTIGNELFETMTVTPSPIASPVSVVLALDWSKSVTEVLDVVQEGANTFISNLTNDDDEAAVCKFNADIGFEPPSDPYFYTDENFGDLTTYINTDGFGDTLETWLYDAVYESIGWAAAYGSNIDKRAVVVMSDGHDYGSVDTLDDVTDYAVAQEIPVFTIYYVDPDYQGGGYGNPEILLELATDTGGQYYDATTENLDLNEVYEKIANTLSSKYTITDVNTEECIGTITVEVDVEYDEYGDGSSILIGRASRTVTF